ncbi:hypothetical protein D9757_008839 [Collybiopsis confluens]|uniref:Saccharopine dehydrogenase NADP binding domain-containing protein n=1 Tax=Collybiopsis confluens TaxID=2823264 RepID=A0A8H5H3I7_9AGAR|nr:hypothetical protein D9757_008839 [Collybiopsis confluens]
MGVVKLSKAGHEQVAQEIEALAPQSITHFKDGAAAGGTGTSEALANTENVNAGPTGKSSNIHALLNTPGSPPPGPSGSGTKTSNIQSLINYFLMLNSLYYDILILGATGVTGRQTARYLAAHPQQSQFTFSIAGRSRAKLDTLISELSLPNSVPVHVVDVLNFEQVEAVVKKHKVVLTTVGPYVKWGKNVVRACARNGVHYADLTGEQLFVKEIIERYAYIASKTGSTIIPSCGLDSLPSDIAVFVANKVLKEYSRNSEPLQIDSSTSALEFEGVFSNGTVSTVVTAIGSTPSHKLSESLQDHFLSPVSGKPSPAPRLTYSLALPSTLRTVVGGYFLMSSTNKSVVQRSAGLLEYEVLTSTYASGSRAQKDQAKAIRERYGAGMVYEEFLRTNTSFMGALVTLGLFFGLSLMALPPVRWFVGRLGMKETSVIIDKQLAEQGRVKLVNVTIAEPSSAFPKGPVKVETTIAAKGDPGYYLSPIMMAESGLALLLNTSSLPILSSHGRGGVLTPAVALGNVIVDRLREYGGFEIRSELYYDGESRQVNGNGGGNGSGESRKSV